MRLLLLLLVSAFSSGALKAQLSGNTTFATIYDIKDENNKVIAKMSKVQGLRADMFLKTCTQKKDTIGSYVTEYAFMRPAHLVAKNISLILQFDKMFEKVYFNTEGEIKNIKTTIADNNSGTSFQASDVAADAIVTIKVISKKPVIATITGIAGQLN